MWRATILANVLLMYLFWLAGLIMVTPAYNHFMRYGQAGDRLPQPTVIAISLRVVAVGIPMVWTVLSFFIFKILRTKAVERRVEFLLAYTMATLVVGFFILLFFSLSGILPFLQIGEVMQ